MSFLNKIFMGGDSKSDIFGKKPVYKTPEASAAEEIQANLSNLPKSEELAGKVNTFNQQAMLDMLRKSIPGFDQIVARQSDILQSGLRGEVPTDVASAVSRHAAAKSLAGGYAGSGAAGALEARDFGMTSWDITNRSLDSASKWTANMKDLTVPSMWNIGSSFVRDQAAFNKLQADVTAAPDPRKRGLFDAKMGTMGMVLGAYAGGAGYGGYSKSAPGQADPGGYDQYLGGGQNWSSGAGIGASEGGGNIGSATSFGESF